MSASSAATEIMNTPRSEETSTRVVVLTRRVGHQDSLPLDVNSFARGFPFITAR